MSVYILRFLLLMAAIGTASSTVFLVLALLGTAKFHKDAKRWRQRSEAVSKSLPAVSVLKPLHGMEARLTENLESFFLQDYPDFEILFAADEADDAALGVVRGLMAKYPRVRCRIVVNGKPPWPNPPAYSFHCMTELAQHEILVTSDSDVWVARNYLGEIVPPLLDQKVGMVTCVYRGGNAGGFWSGLDAIGMSVEMTAGVLVANLLEGMKFGLGPTIAVRKDSLAKIGGYGVLGEYFSNDFVIGNLMAKAGYEVVLSHHVIEHVVPPMTFQKMWDRQVRWAKGTRYSRPKGHFGTGLVFAMPFGIIGLLATWALGHPLIGVAMFAAAAVNRMIESLVIGWGVVRDPVALRSPWLYPVRDVLGFLVWCASYVSKKAVWRDHRFELVEGGKIVLRQTTTAV
jgi:ceramide glucosyltransferase